MQAGTRLRRPATAAVPTVALPDDPFIGGTDPGNGVRRRRCPAAFRPDDDGPFVSNKNSQSARRASPRSPASPMPGVHEVKALGPGEQLATPEQTDLARFWLANPFHAWHATVRSIAEAHVAGRRRPGAPVALVSLASADAAISCWDSKFHYSFWRPETAIQRATTTATRAPRAIRTGSPSSRRRPIPITPPGEQPGRQHHADHGALFRR